MDTKRHPEQRFRENAGTLARSAIDSWKPDLIIAGDDDAQKYAARHYADSTATRIVFLGINGQIDTYGYHLLRHNVTGIQERKQLNGVREMLLDHARLKGIATPMRIIHIGDNSHSVAMDDEFILAFDRTPLTLVDIRLVSTFPEWQQAVLDAQRDADFILTTNYRKLAVATDDRTLVAPEAVVAWSEEHSSIPLIGTNGFFVEDGGMIAIATSPYEQGEVAARMAIAILEGTQMPEHIPIESTRQFIVSMREQRILARDFDLPDVYESFARSTNNYFP
jgi:ABC-type uncharacterized transport system substrate-binding protein